MAPPVLGVCRQALRASHRTQWLSYRQCQAATLTTQRAFQGRSFSSTSNRRDDKNDESTAASKQSDATSEEASSGADNTPYFNDSLYASLYSAAKDQYLESSPQERRQLEDLHSRMQAELGPDTDVGRDLDALAEQISSESREELKDSRIFYQRPRRWGIPPEDFSTMSDPDAREIAPDEEFMEDDITSMAHAQLDTHREIREFSRLAAWEMPLLTELAVPYRPHSDHTNPLRWRYTTYLGTPHPAANKVVLTFSPHNLPLSPSHLIKFIKLCGPRYDPHSRTVKMSSESFPSQAQNKRHLGSTLANLMKEAKDDTDKMEDIPFDFRHARRAATPQFPKEWVLTEGRRRELEATWAESRVRDEEAQGKPGGKVEGVRMIEEARLVAAGMEMGQRAEEGAMALAGQAVRGKAK